jgi:hypothetical protein
MNDYPRAQLAEATLSQVLYWYIWPFWMFKDVNRGSTMERIAAYRYNRDRRMFLPPYLVKWCLIFCGFVGAIALFDTHGELYSAGALLASGTGLLAAWSLVVVMMIFVTWLCLSCWDHPGQP